MNVAYISLNYGKTRDGVALHLVRLQSGKGYLFTSEEMIKMGLADYTHQSYT